MGLHDSTSSETSVFSQLLSRLISSLLILSFLGGVYSVFSIRCFLCHISTADVAVLSGPEENDSFH